MDIFLQKRDTFRKGGIREILYISMPMVVSYACDTVMTFTDRLFLSSLGPEQMNAALAGGMSVLLMNAFFLGLIGYSTALVAQFMGAAKKSKVAVVTTQALIIAVLAYFIILILRPLGVAFFDLAGLPEEQIFFQTQYYNILIFGAVFSLLRQVFSCFFSGIGRTRIVMIAALVSMVVNIGVNYILIFGRLGVPAMGIEGAAIGTIIAGFCGLLVLLFGYFKTANRIKYSISKSFYFSREIMKKLIHFGYPAGLEFFLNFLAFTALVFIFQTYNAQTATAASIMFNWDMVSFVPLIGIEIGVTSLVGRYMGAGKADLAYRSAISGIKAGMIYSVVVFIAFVFFTGFLVDVFQPQGGSEIFDKARPLSIFMIRVAAIYVLTEAVLLSVIGALRGAGDTHWAMRMSVTVHYLMAAIVWLLLRVLGFSPEIAWSVVVVVFVLFTYVFFRRFKKGKWKKIKVV